MLSAFCQRISRRISSAGWSALTKRLMSIAMMWEFLRPLNRFGVISAQARRA